MAETTLLAGDLRDEAFAEDVISAARAIGRLRATVNIAGIHGPVGASPDILLDDFRQTLEINVFALTKLCQLTIAEFVATDTHGRIVNIASGAAISGASLMMSYNSSKHAVLGVTRCLAKEFARQGIAVNAVCPGYVASEMVNQILQKIDDTFGVPFDPIPTIPAGRMAMPDEIANVIEYLTFDAPDYLTGTALLVDGGLYA
jgi:NAD(P)-dependent dehydrogenase (short-subunit alcohol dehydrogenase family)